MYHFNNKLLKIKMHFLKKKKKKKKKNQIFGLPCCSTCEDLFIDESITTVGLILNQLSYRVISFLEVRTDRHGFGILIWKHVGTQKISTESSKLGVSCLPLYASPDDGNA